MRALFSFIILNLFVIVAAAHEISGKVVDPDGQPVPYAIVSAREAGRQITASKDGSFTLSGLNPGTYSLKIRHIGFQAFETQVVIAGHSIKLDSCQLELNPVQLGEVLAFADGMTMEQYILQNFASHNRKLKEVCPNYDCDAKFSIKQDFDWRSYPKALCNAILAATTLVGKRSACLFAMNHPVIDVTTEAQLTARDGKVKVGKNYVTHSNFEFTDKDTDGLNQWAKFFPDLYEQINCSEKSTCGKKGAKKHEWTYVGTYEDSGHTIYVLQAENVHAEIVKDLWCMRALRVTDGTSYYEYVFEEVCDDAFLPVAYVQKSRMALDENGELAQQEWEEMKREASSDAERLQAIEQMQKNYAAGETGADIVFLVTYQYDVK